MPKFTGHICVTARVMCEALEVEADTLEEAIAKVKAEGVEPYVFSYDRSDGHEGDEIAYLTMRDDEFIDDVEIDLTQPGEPFSWVACQLAKDIAATPDIPDWSLIKDDPDRLIKEIETWRVFQARARAACNGEE